jgi:hypothetical protein
MLLRQWRRAIGLAAIAAVGLVALVFMLRAGRRGAVGGAGGPGSSSVASAGSASELPSPSAARPKWDTQELPNWPGLPLRPMDHDLIDAMLSGHIARQSMLDLFPDRPYRVRLVGSADMQLFQFAMIDLDRDGKWDEQWDLSKPGQIQRHVAHDPAAGGHEVMYTLAHGKWQPH